MGKKLTLLDCQNIAEERGGKCLSEEYNNKRNMMQWKCNNDHIWNASFGSVKHHKSWCIKCCNTKKAFTLEYCHKIAEERGGKCLSEKYINKRTIMKWLCKNGHCWDAKFEHINSDKAWCPHCSKSRSEILTRSILEELTGLFFPSIRPDFLKNPETNCNLELDGYCDDLKLAFEYQGKQHYEFIEHFHKSEEIFEYKQNLDRLKLKLCKMNEISVILIPYTFSYKNESDLRTFIKDSLIPFGFE